MTVHRIRSEAKTRGARMPRTALGSWIDRLGEGASDNGIRFTNRVRDKYGFHHIFNRVCDEHGVGHRLTKVKHLWTNGQVERMNRTIKGRDQTPGCFIGLPACRCSTRSYDQY